jgi:hypothetical protein
MSSTVQTYAGLTTAIQQWANRNDSLFILNIPIFISLTEQEIFWKLSTIGNEVYATGNFTANNGTFPKPALWGKTARFTYIDENNNLQVLKRVSVSYIYQLNPNPTAVSTPPLNPRYYTDYGFPYFLISPTPTTAFPFELAYFQKIPPLSPEMQTNWNTQNVYDALFFGCMQKASTYINASDWAQYYASLYESALAGYDKYDKERLTDATTNVKVE